MKGTFRKPGLNYDVLLFEEQRKKLKERQGQVQQDAIAGGEGFWNGSADYP